MLVDKFDYFKTAGATTDTLTAAAETEVLSDARYYPPEGKYADGSGEKILEIIVDTLASGYDGGGATVGHTFQIKDCALEGGTYVSRLSYHVSSAALLAAKNLNKTAARLRLPIGLSKYIKVTITGGSGVTGNSIFKARIVNG